MNVIGWGQKLVDVITKTVYSHKVCLELPPVKKHITERLAKENIQDIRLSNLLE